MWFISGHVLTFSTKHTFAKLMMVSRDHQLVEFMTDHHFQGNTVNGRSRIVRSMS
jgi:hypothetical protein